MSEEPPPLVGTPVLAPADRSLVDDVRSLIDDGRTLVEAELAFQKSRAAYAGTGFKDIALYGVVAAVFAIFALFALVFGLILALAPLVTAWGATAIVVGILGAGAALSARMAARRWSLLTATLGEDQADG